MLLLVYKINNLFSWLAAPTQWKCQTWQRAQCPLNIWGDNLTHDVNKKSLQASARRFAEEPDAEEPNPFIGPPESMENRRIDGESERDVQAINSILLFLLHVISILPLAQREGMRKENGQEIHNHVFSFFIPSFKTFKSQNRILKLCTPPRAARGLRVNSRCNAQQIRVCSNQTHTCLCWFGFSLHPRRLDRS